MTTLSGVIVMRRAAAPLVGLVILLTAVLGTATAATAIPAAVGTVVNDEAVDELARTGRIVEVDFSASLDAAIDQANAAGVAVAVLDLEADGPASTDVAERFNLELDTVGSPFHTVFVVANNGYGAHSWQASNTELYLALDDAFAGISSGDLSGGLNAFVNTLPSAGVFLPDPETETDQTSELDANAEPAQDSGGGIGFGTILLGLALLGGAFLLIRRWQAGRRERAQAAADMAEDRAEIVEQLRANADRVILLGDRVIASKNQELIELYEQASASYQAVSDQLDRATTGEEIDALDDRIDTAEWQFSVIEAELDGRPRPEKPTDDDAPASDRPVIDASDAPAPASADGRPGQSFPAPTAPTPRRGSTSAPRSRSGRRGRAGGGLGGGLGGALGGVLGDIIFGGGGLGSSPSRRTQRRSGSGFPSGGGFGFPSSSPGRTSRPTTRSSRPSNRPSNRSGSSTRFPRPGSGSSARRNSRSRPSSRRGSSGGRTVRRSNRGSSGRRSAGRSGRSSRGGRSF
jgi:hypothetical protein